MSLTKVSYSMINGAVVNVLDYGAIADWNGSTGTDNVTALNAAYSAVASTGGTVYLPKGTYYCSGLFGSNPNGSGFADNVEIVGEQGTTLVFSGTHNGVCVCLNGNNVAVRNIIVNSTRSIDYQQPLGPQRVIYQIGIYIGGKETLTSLSDYKSGAQVTNCQIYNMNLPVVVQATGNAKVTNCTVDQFTDTGIIVNNCTTDIWLTDNKVTRGGDDCIFVRHYDTSPYVVAGAFTGRVYVTGNTLHNTFGKSCGFGGVGGVVFSDNYCSYTWAAGVNLENTWGGQVIPNNYEDVIISNNIFYKCGQNWGSSQPNPAHQVPVAGNGGSAISTVTDNEPTKTYIYKNISITNNIIKGFYADGIILSAVKYVKIEGNTFIPMAVDHGSGANPPIGSGIYLFNINNIVSSDNTWQDSDGVVLDYCYSVAKGTGGSISNIRFVNNIDKYSIKAIAFSDTDSVNATNIDSYDYDTGGATFDLMGYTYANLPSAASFPVYTGSIAYCTNGRKVGEGAGAGTGVPVYYANGSWRVFSTDAPVAA